MQVLWDYLRGIVRLSARYHAGIAGILVSYDYRRGIVGLSTNNRIGNGWISLQMRVEETSVHIHLITGVLSFFRV